MFQVVFYPALILVVLIIVEYKYGRLDKPWHHWFLIVFSCAFMGGIIHMAYVLDSGGTQYWWTMSVMLPALYYLFLWMLQHHVIGPKPTSKKPKDNGPPKSCSPTMRHSKTMLKEIVNGVAPAFICVVASEAILASSQSLSESIYLRSGETQGIFRLCCVLGPTVLLLSCLNGLIDMRNTHISGLIIGIWTALYWIVKLTVIGSSYVVIALMSVVVPMGWIGGIAAIALCRLRVRRSRNVFSVNSFLL